MFDSCIPHPLPRCPIFGHTHIHAHTHTHTRWPSQLSTHSSTSCTDPTVARRAHGAHSLCTSFPQGEGQPG
jgi:hypothetical protein